MLPQTPFEPLPFLAAEQAWHRPVHAALQHTPSTQNPLPHWLDVVQAPPRPTLPAHWPPEQNEPDTQSVSPAQDVLQAVVLHTKGEQVDVAPATQAPVPLQVAATVCDPPAHDAAEQRVPDAYFRHAPAPSQTPSEPQLVAP